MRALLRDEMIFETDETFGIQLKGIIFLRTDIMNLGECNVFSYSEEQFVFQTETGNKSKFDIELELAWTEKMQQGIFRYQLDDLKTKYVPGKYNFVAQLNIKRGTDRRKPHIISDIIMPFNSSIFHFGKVSNAEILFKMVNLGRKNENCAESKGEKSSNVLIINVSPLEYCNSLLIPSLEKCYPQVLTADGLQLAFETILISKNPALRIAFNSLGAWASVNHFHFHIYYLEHTLFLENAAVECLMGDCYELSCYPGNSFVFQLLKLEDIAPVTKSIMKLIQFLLHKKIAHNVFITRGSAFKDSLSKEKVFSSIRIYIWARKSTIGSEYALGFNSAVCELGGHLPIRDTSCFETITEDEVSKVLQDACQEIFSSIRNDVKLLYL